MYKFLKIRCLNFYSAFQIECIVTEIFSVEFEFVKVNHDCTLTSVLLLQYKYVLYINYIYIYKLYDFGFFFIKQDLVKMYFKTQQIAPGYNNIIICGKIV